ncbi:MAG: thioredoxin-like domain-containing protein [Ignavibacteriales bacterium]|nr:thioredoxin-like domain-containing protein [Ignavibacteriales bacterium]
MRKIMAFLIILSTVSVSQEFVVRGRIVGPTGTPLPLTKIRVVPNDTAGTPADPDGYFRIVLPACGPRNLFIKAGKGYGYGGMIPLLMDADDSVAIAIRLDSVKQAEYQFADPASRTARFARLHTDLSHSYMDFIQSLQSLERDGRDTKAFYCTWKDTAARLKQSAATETDPVIQGEFLLRYYRLTSVHRMTLDTLFYRKMVASIPVNSPLWFFNNYEAFDQPSLRPDGKAFLDSMIETHPSRELRAFLLFETAREAQSAMDEMEVRRNYEKLKEDFSDIWWSKIADQWIIVDTKVKQGAQIPDFTFPDMDDSTIVYTRSSLKGNVFLLDFWATWCLPCRGEIPYLQKAYERYQSKGLQIISISSDLKKSDVDDFRLHKAKMPWKHVWLSKDDLKTIHDRFEVTGIPKPILVGRDGEIVGLKNEVREEKLERALEKVFGNK